MMNNTAKKTNKKSNQMRTTNKWSLFLFDALFYLFSAVFILVIYPSSADRLNTAEQILCIIYGAITIFIPRFLLSVYKRIWRYAGSSDYLWLVIADFIGGTFYVVFRRLFMSNVITFVRAVSIICLNLLGSICMRLVYQYLYQNRNVNNPLEKAALRILKVITGIDLSPDEAVPEDRKIRIAIVGAGSVGAMLADELINNPKAIYKPICFIDINKEKTGRMISGIPVISSTDGDLGNYIIQEVVFALPHVGNERRKELYKIYKSQGYQIKIYDYPSLESSDGRRHLRDLLLRICSIGKLLM